MPMKKVKTLLTKKPVQFWFPSKKSNRPGMSIAKDSHKRKIPITDTIGCIIIDAVFIFLLYTYLISLYTNLWSYIRLENIFFLDIFTLRYLKLWAKKNHPTYF
jgi:hypothetical protein